MQQSNIMQQWPARLLDSRHYPTFWRKLHIQYLNETITAANRNEVKILIRLNKNEFLNLVHRAIQVINII